MNSCSGEASLTYNMPMPTGIYFRDYTATYISRDVAECLDVRSVTDFTVFLRLCAENAGNLLNLSGLARDTAPQAGTSPPSIT